MKKYLLIIIPAFFLIFGIMHGVEAAPNPEKVTSLLGKSAVLLQKARTVSCGIVGSLTSECYSDGIKCDQLQAAKAEHKYNFKEDAEFCSKAAEEIVTIPNEQLFFGDEGWNQ